MKDPSPLPELLLFLLLFSFTSTAVAQTAGTFVATGNMTTQRNGKIAFASDRDGNFEIYTINPDGSDEVRLTNSAEVDSYPTWSPDGRMIAFISQTPVGDRAIFRMNEDGTNKAQVTPIRSSSGPLSWSPDGGRIAFRDQLNIFVVNIDGSNRRNLTADNPYNPGDVYGRAYDSWDTDPSWSPDGSRILFSRYIPPGIVSVYAGPVLHTINPEGTELRALPNGFRDGFGDFMPSWSPNGDKIIFSVNVWDFANDIFIANADGTERRFFHGCNWLDNSCPWDAWNAQFSPDGTKIVFSMVYWRNGPSQGSSQIFVKNIDGTGLTLLAGSARTPSWQPIPDQLVAGLGFDRTTVVAGTSYSFNVSGTNLTPQAFFDVRFIAPGSRTSDVVLNWQRGVTASHEVPIGTASGIWTINGVRPHQIETDHTGSFIPVSATITVSP